MMRGIPESYSRDDLVELLNSWGFYARFDFLYLPADGRRSYGYAFVNLITPADVKRFWAHFEGFGEWGAPHTKVGAVSWSTTTQGLQEHIERFRNSPLMHSSSPDELRPALFSNGVRAPFHPPTQALRPPRKPRAKNSRIVPS